MSIRRLVFLIVAAAALAGCGDVHVASLSPNDPGYRHSGAPQNPQIAVRAPGNERIYRSLENSAVY